MLTLYGHVNPLSINTLKVRVALAEVNAEFRYQPVDLAKGEQHRAEFVALNPYAKIPLLVDDDFILAESDAIMWYLAETFAPARLLGTTPRERARTLQWCDFVSTGLYPAYYDLYLHTVSNAPDKRLPTIAESATKRLARSLGVLEPLLGKQETLTGQFSIADLSAAVVVRNIQDRLPFDVAAHPHLLAWYARVTTRGPWQAAMAAAAH